MIKYAIIPAAGNGSRLYPLTKYIPKEMLPINNLCLIEYAINECMEGGIEKIIVVTSNEKLPLIRYQLKKYSNKIRFDFVIQEKPNGLGDAILCAKNLVSESSFFVILPDELIISNNYKDNILKLLFKKYIKVKSNIVAVQKIELKQSNKYAMVIPKKNITSDFFEISGMIEKPDTSNSPSSMAVIGRYLLTKTVFEYIEKQSPSYNNEIQLTDALHELANYEKMYSFVTLNKRFDVGNIKSYFDAKKDLENDV